MTSCFFRWVIRKVNSHYWWTATCHLSKMHKQLSFTRDRNRFYLVKYKKGSTPGRRPWCTICKEYLLDGLIIEIDGRYRNQQHTFEKTFRYCLKGECLKRPPKHSLMKSVPNEKEQFPQMIKVFQKYFYLSKVFLGILVILSKLQKWPKFHLSFWKVAIFGTP